MHKTCWGGTAASGGQSGSQPWEMSRRLERCPGLAGSVYREAPIAMAAAICNSRQAVQESLRRAHVRAGPASNRPTRAGRNQKTSTLVVLNSREFWRLNVRHKHLLLLAGVALLTLIFSGSALADYRAEKNLKLESGGRFSIDSSAGSVTITGTSESGARIVATSNRDDLEDLFDLQFEESAGEVRVTARKKHMFGWPNHLRLHFDVRVPA